MKEIKTVDAVGQILCHDITQIIPGVIKDAAFRKGHVVRAEDIPVLLSMGKDNLFVWESQPGMLHENDAAEILYGLCAGENMVPTEVKEGKIDVIADCDGVFLVDTRRMRAINSLGEMMIATRHGNFPVKKGDKLAGTRIIPLLISEEKLARAQEIGAGAPLLALKKFLPKKVAVVCTGNEVFYGRVKDAFSPVIVNKVRDYGADIFQTVTLPDSPDEITAAILSAIEGGAEMVVCTGGMSVDPDDRTPLAIKNTGAAIVSHGAPVLPGSMFMLAYHETGVPILGLPGCVMYTKYTIFDLVLPKLMADLPISQDELSALGHGGLCLDCKMCTYPNCGFGKGG